IGKETLARKLNMDSWIESRQKSRIDKKIQEALETAFKLNYLLSYREDDAGLFWLRLNPERCGRLRAKLERKKVDWREVIKPYKIARQQRLDKETG
ncbi:MAG: hypothetical protein ACP5D2_05195, partial [Candidatus Nanoarchaeia archaeon]